jgi:hypothetical protein
MTAFYIAVVGVIGTVLGSVIAGALATRAKVNDDMRQLRLGAYPSLWDLTSCFSKWPPTPMSYARLREFLDSFRAWYYQGGGLYLSENGQERYGEVHELLVACFGASEGEAVPAAPPGAIPEATYRAVREAVSTLRRALTEDLESRRQRSLVMRIAMAIEHRNQSRTAVDRLRLVRSKSDDRTQAGPLQRPKRSQGFHREDHS